MSQENQTGKSDSAQSRRLDDLLAQAEALSDEKRWDEAVAALEKTIERFPDSPLPHHALSVVYLLRLREDYEHLEVWEDLADDERLFESAVDEAEAAIDLDEEFVPARNNLATLFALRGWWKAAVEQWETSLTIRPDQSRVREELNDARKNLE
ncbi:tetratricopeptide repeat protein [Candidatus Sumerlaeota bacterium]|nr:tetratricopeptide repeat protein [Candidatus Sumerlaeota bacterium]